MTDEVFFSLQPLMKQMDIADSFWWGGACTTTERTLSHSGSAPGGCQKTGLQLSFRC